MSNKFTALELRREIQEREKRKTRMKKVIKDSVWVVAISTIAILSVPFFILDNCIKRVKRLIE